MSIRIDKEFESLIPPLSDDEFEEMTAEQLLEILKQGL